MKKNLSKKIIFSCFLAGCLEMYDFSIFVFLTSTLHKNYLVFMDKNTALIVTYALFAVGFIFRPIGSIIFGYIGDKFGRKKALVLSVSLMGSASLVMFLLPPYAIIGISSCYIIALVRIIQGISVGGEYSGALIYSIEHFNKKNAGIVGGIIVCGTVSGALLATLGSNILQNPSLPDYSWRFAFLLGFGLSIVGYFIRKKLTETPEFQNLSVSKKIPLLEGFKNHTTECIATIFISAANGVNFYFILVFLPSYINQITGLKTSYFPLITTSLLVILAPIFGFVSDKINREKMISYGLITIAIYSFVGLYITLQYPSLLIVSLFIIGQVVIYSVMTATVNIFVIEIFPVKYRFSCSSFCYSIGMGFIGGTSPLIASFIIKTFGSSSIYLSTYISFISFLGYLGVIAIKRSRNKREVNY